MHCQVLWDGHVPEDWHDERVATEEVGVFLSDSSTQLSVSVDPDEIEPDDETDVLQGLLLMLDTAVEPGEMIRFFDQDGEYAYFRAADVALLTVPLRLINPALDRALAEREIGPEDEPEALELPTVP